MLRIKLNTVKDAVKCIIQLLSVVLFSSVMGAQEDKHRRFQCTHLVSYDSMY